MNNNPIFANSVISFPDRGYWGDKDFRGNTSGWIVKGFLERWHHDKGKLFVDPAEGSGTSRDVATELSIPYIGLDLQQGFNILKDDLYTVLGQPAGSVFFHPPYHQMIRYSQHPDDLSNCSSVDEFIEKCILAVMNIYRALDTGGFYGVLMGNMRRSGQFWPLASMLELGCPGRLEVEIVKIQHNVSSMRTQSTSLRYLPTMHEKLLIFEKSGYLLALDVSIRKAQDLVREGEMTWRNLVAHTIRMNGGMATLQELYEEIEGSEKAKRNQYWREKVRQTCISNPDLIGHIGPAQYELIPTTSL